MRRVGRGGRGVYGDLCKGLQPEEGRKFLVKIWYSGFGFQIFFPIPEE